MVDGPIEFSPEALEAFRSQVRKASPDVNAIRLGIKGGACSGMQYVIEFDYGPIRMGDTEWNPTGWDELTHRGPGQLHAVTFRVDKKSVLYLSGSRVTWHKSLMKEGFEFENPHEASRCGCGHSFSPK
jgi:iron-sulfur cluster assembly protein